MYIDAINEGVDQKEEVLEKIKEEDQTYFQPLKIDPLELFHEHIGSDEKLNVSTCTFTWVPTYLHMCKYQNLILNSPPTT